jgi:hypothetical protein
MATLTQIFAALQGIADGGGEMKASLQAILAEKDKTTTELETKLNTATQTVSTITKALDCAEDAILPTIKAFKAKDTEIENFKQSLANKDTEISTLKSTVGVLERKQTLQVFCGVVGADPEVVGELLPSELEVNVKEVSDKGKTSKQGFVVVDGKPVSFADYVAADPKLVKFSASIFPQSSNPPSTPPKLPSGKSEAPKLSIVDSLKANQKTKAEAVRRQING